MFQYAKTLLSRMTPFVTAKPETAIPDASSSNGNRPFQLGHINGSNRRHQPPAMSGDAAIYMAADLMNRRGREMYTNQGKFKRPIDLLRDLVVGTGIHTFADPVDYSFGAFMKKRQSDLMRSFDYALESDEKFLDWANDPLKCDVKRKSTFFEMQAMCLSETATVGDGIIKFVYWDAPKGEIPLKLTMIEREQLDNSKDTLAAHNGNRIVNGIEFDPDGYEVGIHVLRSHPHDSFGSFGGSSESDFIPAQYYLHFFKKSRPSQHIGATLMHALAGPVVKRNEYLMTELRKAIKQAQHVLVLQSDTQHNMSVGFDADDPIVPEGNDISMGYDPLATQIGKDDELKLLDANSPNDNAGKFFELMDTDMAGAANLSPYTMTGRFEKVNQSGFRASLQLEDSQTRPLKNAIGQAIAIPVRREFNRLAVASGNIRSVTAAEFVREQSRFQRFDCIGPGRILLDAEMEIEAGMAKIRGGTSTLKIECAKLGLHYIHVLRQIKLENILCEEMGITLDHSKGQGGQNEGNTRSAKVGSAAFDEAVRNVVASMEGVNVSG